MNGLTCGSILDSLLWCWKTCAVCCNENLVVWNTTIVDQLHLTQYIENVTMYSNHWNTTNCLCLSLGGGTNYELDIVKLMKISGSGSLVLESKDGSAEINCTVDQQLYMYDPEELYQTVQPLSRASLVLLDGLTFTGCPVPILIEEAANVVIQNCVFQ